MGSTPEAGGSGVKVAFLGPPGTFGEEAARRHFPGSELLPYQTHGAVARAVEAGEAETGVMAIENSLNGSVPETLDILIHETALKIQGEVLVPVVHNLVAAPGTAIDDIELIYSHPQALGQCRVFLGQHCPEAQRAAALSTAQAVELAVAQPGAAAISTVRAAEIYRADVLAEAIQDQDSNATRFVVVGRHEPEPSGRDRTSIAFEFAGDRAGLLTAALTEFSSRGINCTKMESRPTRATFGEYIFLIDFEGHEFDPECAAALDGLRGMTTMLKVFGSYPRAFDG
ncbi:MAG: prephenate dehydratase [Dehalococcoidia bacterium]|nr:prephenate dehydratase [Dehalococcoidia bacterium]MYD29839.1 prephenate dehydratase [Dehalococcoidia bacterium]